MDGTAGAQVLQTKVAGDDLIFKSQGGDSLITLKSEGQTEIHGNITASGVISASGGFVGDGTNLSNVSATISGDTFATDLKIGRDSTDLIDFTTNDNIIFRTADVNRFQMDSAALFPVTDGVSDLGTDAKRWEGLFTDEIVVTNHITASGNISGSSTSDLQYGGATIHHVHTINDGNTTPSVSGKTILKTSNSTTTAITALDDGVAGQIVYILIQDNNTDFTDGTNLQLFRGLDHTSAQTNDTITFICVDGTKWVEQGRSDNT